MNKKEYSKFRKTVSNPQLLDDLRQPYLDAISRLKLRTPACRLFAALNIGFGIERLDNVFPISFRDLREYEMVVNAIKKELLGLLHALVEEARRKI